PRVAPDGKDIPTRIGILVARGTLPLEGRLFAAPQEKCTRFVLRAHFPCDATGFDEPPPSSPLKPWQSLHLRSFSASDNRGLSLTINVNDLNSGSTEHRR